MKNLFIIFTLLLFPSLAFADNRWIPEHLINPNYKQSPVDCEKAMKEANPFIPATIPPECMPKKEDPQVVEQVKQIEQSQPKTKIGKFLNVLLEE